MSELAIKVRLTQLTDALAALEEALNLPVSRMSRDSALLNFMLTFELLWKTLKGFLEIIADDMPYPSPRQALKGAFAQGWLGFDEALWVQMHNHRNLIVHTYQEDKAQEIYERLPAYAAALTQVVATLNTLERS